MFLFIQTTRRRRFDFSYLKILSTMIQVEMIDTSNQMGDNSRIIYPNLCLLNVLPH